MPVCVTHRKVHCAARTLMHLNALWLYGGVPAGFGGLQALQLRETLREIDQDNDKKVNNHTRIQGAARNVSGNMSQTQERPSVS